MCRPLLPRRLEQQPPEFFVDRSLGRHMVPEALRARGFTVHTMADVYPDGEDERVIDTRWITEADEAGWVALTKDERIFRNPEEQDALVRSRLCVFAITNQHLTGPEMAERLVVNINRIVQRSRKRGPFVDVIYRESVERRWPRGATASGPATSKGVV
jgi:heme-degrading monooxygenase HmoA